MAAEKNVGGLRCFEVLARLSEYLDGELSAAERAKVDGHLVGCDACTQFGGEFGVVVGALRAALLGEEEVPEETARRLAKALGF